MARRGDSQNTQPEHDHHTEFPSEWHLQTPYLTSRERQHPDVEGNVDNGVRPGHGIDIDTATNVLATMQNLCQQTPNYMC